MGLVIMPQYLRFFDTQIGRGMFATLDGPESELRFTIASLSTVGVRFVIVDRICNRAIERLREIGLKQCDQDRVRLIFENESALPPFYFASSLTEGDMLSTQARQVAVSSDNQFIAAARSAGVLDTPKRDPSGEVTVNEDHHTRLQLRVKNSAPAILVVSGSWHPNWHARVDGAEVIVGRVNIAFRGIALSAGDHLVEYTYRPKTATAGIWISLVSWALIALLTLRQAGTRIKTKILGTCCSTQYMFRALL